MNSTAIHLVLLCCLFAFFKYAEAQNLTDEFDYGSTEYNDITAVASNWVRHGGSQGPTYVVPGLSYSGYPSSGVGGSALVSRMGPLVQMTETSTN